MLTIKRACRAQEAKYHREISSGPSFSVPFLDFRIHFNKDLSFKLTLKIKDKHADKARKQNNFALKCPLAEK